MTALRASRFFALLGSLALLFAAPAKAERLVIVAHPDTGLAAGDVQFPLEAETWYLKALTLLPPIFVSSASAKDAPGDRAFVLLIGKPGTQVVNHKDFLTPAGAKSEKTQEYRTISVFAAADFMLCYREEAGGSLAELGKGVVWGEARQMNMDEDEDADRYEKVPYKISNETPEQLTHRAVRVAVQDIPRLISHIVAPNILVPKTEPYASADEVMAWAKKIPSTYSWKVETKVTSHSRREMLTSHRTNNFSRLKPNPQYSGTYEAKFNPSRITKNRDGSLTVDVDLWNRLPIRVRGTMYRHCCEQEDELQNASSEAAPVTNEKLSSAFMEKRDRAVHATFDLEPGEKKAATFHVPPEWAVDPALVRNDTIVVGIRKLGLMVERAEKMSAPPPAKKKKRK